MNNVVGPKRWANINIVKNLSRRGLKFSRKEREVTLFTSTTGERVCIRFPGKESRKVKKDGITEREPSAIRPWDFRPRFYPAGSATPGKDLAFSDIWAIAFKNSAALKGSGNEVYIRAIAAMFFRMAHMLDHSDGTSSELLDYHDIGINATGLERIGPQSRLSISGRFIYIPNQEAVKMISTVAPTWGGMSFEAFLHYNEYLIWNEDCKYFFREHGTQSGISTWTSKVGRVNTIMSHIHVFAYILGDIELEKLFDAFMRGKGICPIGNADMKVALRGYLL